MTTDFKTDEMCEQCCGRGWYLDGPTDGPQQIQCEACYGTGRVGKEKPQPRETDGGLKGEMKAGEKSDSARRKRSPLAAIMLMAAGLGGLPPAPEPKQKRKCLLKGCDVLTDHNGGYCCAEHHANSLAS